MENQDPDEDQNLPVDSTFAKIPLDPDTKLSLGPSNSTVATGENLALDSSIATSKQNLTLFHQVPSRSNDYPPPGADLTLRLPSSIGPSAPSPPPGADSLNRRPMISQGGSTYGSQVPSSSSSPRPPKPVHMKMNRIVIGEWSKSAVHHTDVVARFFPGSKRLVWEIQDDVETESGMIKQLKRISIDWSDVLSLSKNDLTGCFQIELSKRPTFYKAGDPKMLETWLKIDEFSPNHPSSVNRRHELYFDPPLLTKNYHKIQLTAKNLWSRISQVPFPSLPHLTFSEEDNIQNVTQDQLRETQASQSQPNPPQEEEEEEEEEDKQRGLKRGREY